MKTLLALAAALGLALPGFAAAAEKAEAAVAAARKTEPAAAKPAKTSRRKPSRISRAPKPGSGPLRPVNITSRLFEIEPNSGRAVWTGEVVVERDDLKVTCDRLTADFDDAKRVRKVTCEGNAHMVQRPRDPARPEREAWGQVAVFDNEQALLTVTGEPRAREGENTFRGEKVLFHVDEDRVVVEKPEMEFETKDGAPALGKDVGGSRK